MLEKAKKTNFIRSFFKSKKTKGVEKSPKLPNLASKKPHWQWQHCWVFVFAAYYWVNSID